MDNIKSIGSKTAKNGFKNEKDVIDKFNNWQQDEIAKEWLKIMGYDLNKIEFVKAEKIKGNFKADIQIKVEIKYKILSDVQNLQVKLISNDNGFNQIDKRWVDKYTELWTIPEDIVKMLKYYTGECLPYKKSRDNRRMFIDELIKQDQEKILDFFRKNKILIITDIIKGRGEFSAEWFLVIQKTNNDIAKWALKNINFCLNLFSDGDVEITKKGNIKIGKITVQRKGGDGGKKTAQMLQFKINPSIIFD